MRTKLSICIFLYSEGLSQSVALLLASDRYIVTSFQSEADFVRFVESEKQHLDCLILEDDPAGVALATKLRRSSILLPAAIVRNCELPSYNGELNSVVPLVAPQSDAIQLNAHSEAQASGFYHPAEVVVYKSQLNQIGGYIDQAIAQFLNLSVAIAPSTNPAIDDNSQPTSTQHFLVQQQRRLAEKLRERLGYLGVYYKRNPQRFLRHLSPAEKQEFLENLKIDYREIVLNYFSKDASINQKIDDFVNQAFFADLPVTNIVEIHMELMDEFAKQLKLEGRSEEVLLDYRLTLIDTIAHLCEMYRRSIPRES